MKQMFIIACLTITLYSCQSTKTAQTPAQEETQSAQPAPEPVKEQMSTPEQLEGKKWLLTHLNGELLKVNSADQQPFAMFDVSKKTIQGFSGCNSYSGNCELSNNHLKVSLVMSTRRFCEGSPEADFFRLLDKGSYFEVIDNQLYIKDSNELLLTFQGVSN